MDLADRVEIAGSYEVRKRLLKYFETILTCQDHQCGLRLFNVTEADAGTWRCEVMLSSVSPLDSVISLMKQMEEYKFGDWVSGVRHEAEVELVFRNPEEDQEIIFIDDDAEGRNKTNQLKNFNQQQPEVGTNNSEMV